MPLTLSATGYRPPKLGGYNPQTKLRLFNFAKSQLKRLNPTCVISGMAQGWDTAIARAALELNIPLIAAIPCPQQPSTWYPEDIRLWRAIKDRATHVEIISKDYSPAAMQLRNEWMVNRCQLLLALWDGTPGGTANCLAYAKRRKSQDHALDLLIENVWTSYKELP